MRISADDYGKYYLNGKFLGQGPTPGYIESYHYNEFDVTDYLRDGENEIIVFESDGLKGEPVVEFVDKPILG